MTLPLNELASLAWSQIWQVTLLALAVGIAVTLGCRRRPHLAYVLWMLIIVKCLAPPLWSSPTGLFSWLQRRPAVPIAENRPPVADSAPSRAENGSLIEKMMRSRRHSPSISPAFGVETVAPVETVEKLEPPRRWSPSWTAIAATIWSLGACGLAGVLLWKWTAYGRILRRTGSPPDAELESRAARLAERLGLRRAVRLQIVSESIGPAVFGLWRPMVVIPAAMIREKSLQQIEPIVAHELVHVRRGDAVVGVLQLVVQVLWWFHPLVWWANREMCRRREQCCDEEVVVGLGCSSATYARCLVDILEWECCRSRRRLPSAVPGVRSAEITTTRLEHIMDDAKRFHRRTPRWIWGVLAMAMLLVLPGRALVLGQNAESSPATATNAVKDAKADVDRVPTLTEIAKANDAAWKAIRSVDMEYTIGTQCVENGKTTRDMQSTGRWSKSENRERLRRYPTTVKINESQFGSVPSPEFQDNYFDGKIVQRIWDSEPQKEKKDLSCQHQQGLHAVMGTRARHWPCLNEVEPLRYLWDELPLSTIIASWKVSLQRQEKTSSGDTLWLIHAEYPPKNEKDEFAGSSMDIQVNADKGYLVQKVIHNTNGIVHRSDGTAVSSCSTQEVKEFQDGGEGVFYPRKTEFRLIGDAKNVDSHDGYYIAMTATKLLINSPMPAEAFDFRFPENAVVRQELPDEKSCKILIWGPDNKPAKEFSEVEFSKYVRDRDLEEMQQKIEKNLASKQPIDLAERGYYYMRMGRYDEAVAAFSEGIAADPKTEEAASAVMCRGMTYLVKQNFDKAITDLTQAMHLMEKPDKKRR